VDCWPWFSAILEERKGVEMAGRGKLKTVQ
jgi:hypothetical protein